jgi:PAS domain S-box-containing protein
MAITVALKNHPNLNPIISASFVIVISAVAWWAGFWAGILVSCLSIPALTLAATNGKMWLPPHIDFIGLPIFWFICFLVDRVASNRKRIERVLRNVNAELEAKVEERTADLREANISIRDRLAEVELLYSQLPVGVCFLDKNLCFVRINRQLAAMNGVAAADHLGRSLRAIIPPNRADIVEPLYRKILETGRPLVDFELSDPPSDDGATPKTLLVDCCPAKAADGSTIGLQVIVQNITERKRSEQLLLRAHAELAQREREFRTVVNAIPQICWVSGPDGSVLWYNDRWYEYTGIDKDHPQDWKTHIPDDALPMVLQHWKDSIQARRGFEMEVPIRGANGECRWFLARTVAIYDETGNIHQWFGTSTDIDDLKRSREALIAREKELRHANSDLQRLRIRHPTICKSLSARLPYIARCLRGATAPSSKITRRSSSASSMQAPNAWRSSYVISSNMYKLLTSTSLSQR